MKIGSITGKFHATQEKKKKKEKKKSNASLPSIVIKHVSIGLINITPGKDSQPIHVKDIHWEGLINKDNIHLSLSLGPVARFFKSAQFSIIGPLDDYKIRASVVTKYTKLGVTGSGNTHSANFLLSSQSKDNSLISGTVSVSWAAGFKWTSTIQLKNINTKPLLAQGPVINSLNATSSGQFNKTLRVATWQINAKTTAGTFQSQGNYTPDSLLFDWNISDLTVHPFYPKVNGTINSSGAWNNGKTTGMLSVIHVKWQEITLKNFQASWDGNVSTQSVNSLKINFHGLANPELIVRSAEINVNKTVNNTWASSPAFL